MQHRALVRVVGAISIPLLLTAFGEVAARAKGSVCEGGSWIAEGLPPLAVGAERALGDVVVVDPDAGTLRIAGCAAVAASIRGKRNHKLKAVFPPGSCADVEGSVKFKAKLSSDCERLKGRLKTTGRGRRKLVAQPMGAIEPLLEVESAVAETIGPAGGTLETTDAAGRRYRLEVPEGAIPAERLVTLTPLRALDGVALDRLLGAVDLEPSGLTLIPPAELYIEPPDGGDDAEGLVGFAYGGAEGFETHWAFAADGAIRVPVHHFSGVGSGTLSGAALAFQARVRAAQQAGDAQAEAQICVEWFDTQVGPSLQAASDDASTSTATQDFIAWFETCPGDPARYAQGLAWLRPLLEAAVARDQADCRTLRTFESAANAFTWQAAANFVGIATGALSEGAVQSGTCLEVVYEDTSFPLTPQVGVSNLLSVTVGASFDGGPAVFSEPLRVDVTAGGATPGNASGLTNASGVWSHDFAVSGGQDASFSIESCIAAPAYPALSFICQPALVVRGLEINPTSASVDTGATQQFSALRFGSPYANVTWSTTGGSIDGTGTLTAPNTPGTVTVTATDAANPGSQASATVSVTAAPGNPATCVTGPGIPVTHSHGVVVRAGGSTDQGSTMASTSVTRSISQGACTASATSPGFGRGQVSVHGQFPDCGDDHQANASAGGQDWLRITPSDPTRIATKIEGRIEWSTRGSSDPTRTFELLRAELLAHGDPFNPQPVRFVSGEGFDEQHTVDVVPVTSTDTTFRMDMSVNVRALVLSSPHSAEVEASFRWLGITRVLDQDGNPILDYDYCSNSGTDYRLAAP